jgi:hypothetical protein
MYKNYLQPGGCLKHIIESAFATVLRVITDMKGYTKYFPFPPAAFRSVEGRCQEGDDVEDGLRLS